MVIAEVEFSKVAVQMLLAAMLIDALHAALEDRKEAFDRVRMHKAATVFTASVVDYGMGLKKLVEIVVLTGVIGHHVRLAGNILPHNRHDRRLIGLIDMEAAG